MRLAPKAATMSRSALRHPYPGKSVSRDLPMNILKPMWKAFEKNIGRRWPAYLLLAIPALLLALHWYELRGGIFATSESKELSQLLYNNLLCTLFTVLYAWLMIFGFIGMFRQFFSKGNRCIRYISDSSYWLYVMHLPPIMLLQIWMSGWPCLLYTSPSPRDRTRSRMPSSA